MSSDDLDESAYRRILVALAAAGVATFAQLYSPQGILSVIGRDLGVDAATSATTVSAGTLGLAVSVLGWSLVSDRIGRVQAMKIALAAAAVLGLVTAAAPNFVTLLGLRTGIGLALGGVPALAIAYLHEEVPRERATIAAGTYISGTTVGGLLGRLVSAPFADRLGWRAGLGAVAVMAAIAALLFILLVPRPRGFRAAGRAPAAGVINGLAANLRDRRMLVLYTQALCLMGGFVAIYNYLGYRLQAPPFGIGVGITALIFLAYLAGTISSRLAGGLAARRGRRPVLLGSVAVMIIGVIITMSDRLPIILTGLVVMTAGFFGAHAIASGWVGALATTGRAQATALYNLFYYAGSSFFGWLGGIAYGFGWVGTAAMVIMLAVIAMIAATVVRLGSAHSQR